MGKKISSSEYKTDIRSSLAKNVGEKEGEPAKGESRLFQSNNLSYADINSARYPSPGCVASCTNCSLRRKHFRWNGSRNTRFLFLAALEMEREPKNKRRGRGRGRKRKDEEGPYVSSPPLPPLFLASFFARSFTLVPRSLLRNQNGFK